MKNVLLTGSHGYIGTNLRDLYGKEYNFVNVDKKVNVRVENCNDFENIDFIVHLAAISGIQNCEDNKQQAVIDNISATLHLMKAAYAFNIPMLFASSQGAKTPNNTYSFSKYIGEVEAERYGKKYTTIKPLRFANIYGGKQYLQTKTSVVSKFLNAYKNKENLVVHGDGSQIRDFIHVNEICKIICGMIEKGDGLECSPIDVGTGIGRSVKELSDMIDSENVVYAEGVRSVGVQSM